MSLLNEFKAFAVRGNVIDLALAVIIGTAFGKIVSTLVEHVIMPPVGFLIGGVNFSDLAITLNAGVGEPVLITYGVFIQAVIDFLIIAVVLFLALKGINNLQSKKEEAAPAPKEKSEEVKTLEEIRDLLKRREA